MKKILMRASKSPIKKVSAFTVLTKNNIGNNIGNMLFPFSVYRALDIEDVQINTMKIDRDFTQEEIDHINEEYDYFVLPYANAFRLGFIRNLKRAIKLLRKIKIPCAVVGIGFQKEIGEEMDSERLDKVVSEFMDVVLKKSSIVGVRGEQTAEYLKRLGFQEERDFTVIGCPSMFMFGKDIPEIRANGLTKKSSVSFNSKIDLPQNFHDFIWRSMKEFDDAWYVPQVIEEMFRMYAGMPYPEGFIEKAPKHFPVKANNPIYKKGKGVSFVDVPSWLEFMRERDFSIGSRIHGNVAAILAGTPAFVVASDARIQELAEYHHIPHITINELTDKTTIWELYEKTDFSKVHEGHEKRFEHFLDFLHKNNLETIYDKDKNYDVAPMDKKIMETKFEGPLYAFTTLSMLDQVLRQEKFMRYYRNEVLKLKDSLEAEKIKYKELLNNPPKKKSRYFGNIKKKGM